MDLGKATSLRLPARLPQLVSTMRTESSSENKNQVCRALDSNLIIFFSFHLVRAFPASHPLALPTCSQWLVRYPLV
jgi:hypothetical protein